MNESWPCKKSTYVYDVTAFVDQRFRESKDCLSALQAEIQHYAYRQGEASFFSRLSSTQVVSPGPRLVDADWIAVRSRLAVAPVGYDGIDCLGRMKGIPEDVLVSVCTWWLQREAAEIPSISPIPTASFVREDDYSSMVGRGKNQACCRMMVLAEEASSNGCKMDIEVLGWYRLDDQGNL
ncbi:hypothetical protein HHK36_015095 [Tetracentron sinense]|uniref:Uncharacterized protein n=1 Tax=Tetracentron sinense TaxID=13715 RepID=A0A834Z2F9_TETSI|nr:hypothetical protein HHK36_015095 [Tetracentron sinense]